MSKTIVVSGINLVDGGALSVYYDFLDSVLNSQDYKRNKYIILVSRKELFKKYKGSMEILEFPKSKKNWLFRLYYEYWYFNRLSKTINPDIWLSMHDITPRVNAKRRFVYCHNPSPFYKMPISKIKYGWKYYAFSKLYKYLYRINIKKNTAIIVQQEWMAAEFKRMFQVNNIIIARPNISIENINEYTSNRVRHDNTFYFIYPSFPRVYKNFELVCEAARQFKMEFPKLNFKVIITLNGNENNYSNMLVSKYKEDTEINFIGLIKRTELFGLFSKCDCLIFVSKLETWGMPISEFKITGKKIIVSDLPYAYETVGNYKNVKFVNPDSVTELKLAMKTAITANNFNYHQKNKTHDEYIHAENWRSLLKILQNY